MDVIHQHRALSCITNSKIRIDLLWSLYWIEQEDVKMSTPPCHCLEYKAQCPHYVLWLKRGVDENLPELDEAANDSSSTGNDTSQPKPLKFAFHINLCSFQSERQKMSLCWLKRLRSSLVLQLANGSSRQKSIRYMACFILIILCYATLHYIILCILFYDFMCVHIQILIQIYVCEQMNGQQDSAGHALLHEINKLCQCKTHHSWQGDQITEAGLYLGICSLFL